MTLVQLSPWRFMRLVRGDATNVARDPMLLFAAALSIVPPVVFALTRQQLDASGTALGVETISFYVAPVVLVLPAFLIGWVTGFLLLEDRDEGMFAALDTTPLGKAGFLAYRSAVTALITFALTVPAGWLVLPGQPGWLQLCIAVLVAAEAVIVAVALAALARNKVEGLALTKLINLGAVVPLVAAIPSPLRFAGGVVPTYWVGELLHLSAIATIPVWLVATLALIVHAIVLAALLKAFARRAG